MSWAAQHSFPFKPLGRLGLWVKILLGGNAAFGLINSIALQDKVRTGSFLITVNLSGQTQAINSSPISSPLASLAPLLSIATIVVWLIWQHRVTRNVWAKGIRITTSPGWAVGWWFVPLANLFMPAVSVQHVYRASAGEQKHSAWLVTGWWLAWMAPTLVFIPAVFVKILAPIVDGLTKTSNAQQATTIDLSSSMHAIAPWLIALALCQAVSALLAMAIVGGIDKAQETLQAGPLLVPMPARPDLGY
jgi:hypothetical protein